MAVCSAVGLCPPWDTMSGGVGVVLALRFSAYGEARNGQSAGGAWVRPHVLQLRPSAVIHIGYDSDIAVVRGRSPSLVFSFICQKLDAKSKRKIAVGHIILHSVPSVRKRKPANF